MTGTQVVTDTPEAATGARSALLFPGQGGQDRAMRELAARRCPELLAQAVEELGEDPFERLGAGTAFLQAAVFCGAIAHWREAGEPRAGFAAGHSLGELAALAAAGRLSPEEAMRLVLARGIAMQEAAEAAAPGGLLAVIGPRAGALALGRRHGLAPAADNEPLQLVLSGPDERLQEARREARRAGLKAVRVRVPAALHSSAMAPAVPSFRRALERAEIRPSETVVIANVTARPFTDVAAELALGITSCVRWRESVCALRDRGVRCYREMGDAGVLSELVRRTLAAAQPSS